jgi:hypothetical protein
MRYLALLVFVLGCKRDAPEFRASCAPNSALDGLQCVVENVGTASGRACMTAREQPPKAQPLVARRLCTNVLGPGEKSPPMVPTFDRKVNLQKLCAPDGIWVCKDEIVETPQMLGENIPGRR